MLTPGDYFYVYIRIGHQCSYWTTHLWKWLQLGGLLVLLKLVREDLLQGILRRTAIILINWNSVAIRTKQLLPDTTTLFKEHTVSNFSEWRSFLLCFWWKRSYKFPFFVSLIFAKTHSLEQFVISMTLFGIIAILLSFDKTVYIAFKRFFIAHNEQAVYSINIVFRQSDVIKQARTIIWSRYMMSYGPDVRLSICLARIWQSIKNIKREE